MQILIVPEEGWFDQLKYSTQNLKPFYVVSTLAFILSGNEFQLFISLKTSSLRMHNITFQPGLKFECY